MLSLLPAPRAAVVNSAVRHMPRHEGSDARVTLLWLAHLASTQPALTSLSDKTLKARHPAP